MQVAAPLSHTSLGPPSEQEKLTSTTIPLGAQKTDPNGPDFDRQAQDHQGPPRKVAVRPFFLARHELTQGQWLRLSLGKNPSRYPAGFNVPPKPVRLTHPVEQVDWPTCTGLLAKHGLQLPHEREWEYGCRAGTTEPWSCGGDAKDLEGHANILDPYAKEKAPAWSGELAPFRDGHVIHAPVRSFKANGFGLYDLHGNVWEWCRNLYGPASGDRVHRSGGFQREAQLARSASRDGLAPTVRSGSLGLRPAREITP